jgi:hypothetical protein
MGSKKRQQTINKRNRERAVAEKRALKQQARQEKREAARNGELESISPEAEFGAEAGVGVEGEAEPELEPEPTDEPGAD